MSSSFDDYDSFSPIGQNLTAGVNAGANAGRKLSARDTYDFLKKENISLSPQSETALMQRMANEAGNDQARQASLMLGFSTGLKNAARNLEVQRDMTLNAQANSAANVANQLRELGNARQTNASLISNSMNAGVSMFK